SISIDVPKSRRIAPSAVATTNASSATMNDATDVSASTQAFIRRSVATSRRSVAAEPSMFMSVPPRGVDSYRSVCLVPEIYTEPWQTVSAPPGSNGFQAGALWSEGPQIAGEAFRAGPERRRVLAGLREAERPRDAGDDEGRGDGDIHVASHAALRLTP